MDADRARQQLLAERDRLTGLVASIDAELGTDQVQEADEPTSYDQRPTDEGTETFEREKQTAIRDGLVAEIGEIDAALERVDAGTYGIDEETGDPIDPDRLDALPTARTNIR